MSFFKPWKKDIHQQIHALLSGKGINYEHPKEDRNVFVFHSDVDEHAITCILVVNLPANILRFNAYILRGIPKAKYFEVYDYMARVNELLPYGAFHLDPDEALIKSTTTLIMDKAEVTYDQLERLCFNNLLNVHAYQMGLYGVLYKDWTGLDAFLKVRNLETGVLN